MGYPPETDQKPVTVRPPIVSPERRRLINIVLVGLFTALAQVAGALRPIELNVEPKSLIIFLAGYMLGSAPGAMTGLLSAIVHQLLHSGGSPVMVVSQAALWGIFGSVGGLCSGRRIPSVAAATLGFLLTLTYDLTLDTLGAKLGGYSPIASIVQGFAVFPFFTPVHITSNAFLFGLAVPMLGPRILEYRSQLGLDQVAHAKHG